MSGLELLIGLEGGLYQVLVLLLRIRLIYWEVGILLYQGRERKCKD